MLEEEEEEEAGEEVEEEEAEEEMDEEKDEMDEEERRRWKRRRRKRYNTVSMKSYGMHVYGWACPLLPTHSAGDTPPPLWRVRRG